MNRRSLSRLLAASVSFSILIVTSGCFPNQLLGSGGDSGPTEFAPDFSALAPAHKPELPCRDADPDHLCIALKYVSYKFSSGMPIITEKQARNNIFNINSTWAQCHIEFLVETYAAIDPANYGLAFADSHMEGLQNARRVLQENSSLLIVSTGEWIGQLGSQPYNAWSVLPPIGPFGVVVESSVAGYPNIIAHELGHYLNLSHIQDVYSVMNPVIYSNSLNLSPDECAMARATAISFWGATLR